MIADCDSIASWVLSNSPRECNHNSVVDAEPFTICFITFYKPREKLLPTVFRGMWDTTVQIIVCKFFFVEFNTVFLSSLPSKTSQKRQRYKGHSHMLLHTAEIWRKIHFLTPWTHFYHSVGMIDKSFALYYICLSEG